MKIIFPSSLVLCLIALKSYEAKNYHSLYGGLAARSSYGSSSLNQLLIDTYANNAAEVADEENQLENKASMVSNYGISKYDHISLNIGGYRSSSGDYGSSIGYNDRSNAEVKNNAAEKLDGYEEDEISGDDEDC
jgi:hypothetical protein